MITETTFQALYLSTRSLDLMKEARPFIAIALCLPRWLVFSTRKRGVFPAQIALAWMLHKRFVTAPIVGATKMQHLEEAIVALDIALSSEEVSRLESAYQSHPTLEI